MNWFKKYQKFIFNTLLVLTFSALGVFIFGAETANAGLWDIFTNTKEFVLGIVNNVIYYLIVWPLAHTFLPIAGWILDWVMSLQSFVKVPVVETGWQVTRDLTNILFVLILLVIALATILRMESYGIKKALPKLIAVALLINFSLVICGFLIDSTQVLTSFFLDPIQNGSASLSEYVAEGLNISGSLDADLNSVGEEDILVGLIGAVVFIMVMFFVLLAAGFFLLVRVLALWFLIILAPIAWFMAILPATKHLFDRWVKNFTKWILFAPTYAFFFYLALLSIDPANGFLANMQSDFDLSSVPQADTTNQLLQSEDMILQFIFLIGLLLGGLIVAQSMSIHGANGVIRVGQRARRTTTGLLRRGSSLGARSAANLAGRGTRAVGRQATGREDFGERNLRVSSIRDRSRRAMERIPGVREVVGGRGAYDAQRSAQLAEETNRLNSRSNEDIQAIAGQDVFTDEGLRQRGAALGILAERGALTDDLQQHANDYERSGGNMRDIYRRRPDWVADQEEIYNNHIANRSPADLAQIMGRALEEENPNSENVAAAIREGLNNGDITGNHLSEIARQNPRLRVEIQNRILADESMANLNDEARRRIERYLETDAARALWSTRNINQ